MINVIMASSDGVTLNTNGKYCPDNIKVIPHFNFANNAKRWIVTLTGTLPNVDGTMLVDEWIAEHFNDENLCLAWTKVSGDMSDGSCIGGIRCNSRDVLFNYGGFRVAVGRDSSALDMYLNEQNRAIGYLHISQDGSVNYNNGSGVLFLDGVYDIISWSAKNGD